MNCTHCNRECKSQASLRQHQRACRSNPSRNGPWNAGLNKTTDERVSKQAASLVGKGWKGSFTKESLEKLSSEAKARGLGGYRPHPNKGQRYKDVWFDSKWEVRVAESLDSNEIKWSRPRDGLVWTDSGNKYYPDFYLVDYDVYLDPKNDYLRVKDEEKIQQASARNGVKVLVLNESQLKWEEIKKLL